MMPRCLFTLLWILACAAFLWKARGGERRQGEWRYASDEAETLAIFLVILWASVLRFIDLGHIPPSLLADEHMFATDTSWRPEYRDNLYGIALLKTWPWGWCPYIFGWGHNGFPSLSYFLHWAPWLITREPGVEALRAGSGIFGVVSIVIIYVWVRRWWGAVAATAAAIIGAGVEEHIAWSRHAMNNIDMAVIGAWNLAALAYLLDTGAPRAWVSLGMSVGFGWYGYSGAKLSTVLLPMMLLILRRHVHWRGAGWGIGAFFLVTLPLVPDIYSQWGIWYLHHANKVNYAAPLSFLSHGQWQELYEFARSNWRESALMFRGTPWLMTAVWAGAGAALARWLFRGGDYRYAAVFLWFSITGVVGSLGVDWRNSRLFPIWPSLAVLPVLGWAEIGRLLPRRIALLSAIAGILFLEIEAGYAYFVDRLVWDRTTTHALCRIALDGARSVAVIGTERWSVRSSWETCAIPPEKWPARVEPAEAQVWVIFPDAIETVHIRPGQRLDTVRAPFDNAPEAYILWRR